MDQKIVFEGYFVEHFCHLRLFFQFTLLIGNYLIVCKFCHGGEDITFSWARNRFDPKSLERAEF
jgi:hypothetical protein